MFSVSKIPREILLCHLGFFSGYKNVSKIATLSFSELFLTFYFARQLNFYYSLYLIIFIIKCI